MGSAADSGITMVSHRSNPFVVSIRPDGISDGGNYVPCRRDLARDPGVDLPEMSAVAVAMPCRVDSAGRLDGNPGSCLSMVRQE